MLVTGDVKCYHCGHISGQIEGTRTDKLVLRAFKPRAGFQGPVPGPGDRIRCERCGGPVYLEDLQPVPPGLVTPIPIPIPKERKRGKAARSKAA